MSGHNKWSQIKHKKAASDAKKSALFGKLARQIALESKKAGGDMKSPPLRAAIDKAKSYNMPGDNIDRAVKKGAQGDASNMEEVLYEAYGPGGCAILIEGLTDNKNRTTQEVKHIFSKNNLALAGQGAALWNFEKTADGWKAKTTVKLSQGDETSLETLLTELDDHDDVQEVYTSAE